MLNLFHNRTEYSGGQVCCDTTSEWQPSERTVLAVCGVICRRQEFQSFKFREKRSGEGTHLPSLTCSCQSVRRVTLPLTAMSWWAAGGGCLSSKDFMVFQCSVVTLNQRSYRYENLQVMFCVSLSFPDCGHITYLCAYVVREMTLEKMQIYTN